MSRSKKQDYPRKHDSRRFDYTCRCHGSCSHCRDNRLFFDKKARTKLEGQEDEFFGFWSYRDPVDALMDISDEMEKEWGGGGLKDFEAEREY